jgi:hypothetical protein
MPRRNQIEVKSWHEEPAKPICPLCDRPIPPLQLDAHHLVPKSKGGLVTEGLHRICHRHIHANFTEAELADQYSTIEALLATQEIQRFVAWVKTKPPEYYDRSRTTRRIR